jgi:hypothetical protein
MSTPHYNRIGLKELLQNRALASVLPQFTESMQLQNVYSYKKVEEMVGKYVANLLTYAKYEGDGEILAIGKRVDIYRHVKSAVPMIEAFFNSTPNIVKNIRRNTKLYLTYGSIGEIQKIKKTGDKLNLLYQILENIRYNPNFGNTSETVGLKGYLEAQKKWAQRVNFKEQL